VRQEITDEDHPLRLFPFECKIPERTTRFEQVVDVLGPNAVEHVVEGSRHAFYIDPKARWVYWEGFRTKTEADAVYLKMMLCGK
jgi:hypothetical protein